MQCPQCGAENREGRHFCAKCGAPLGIACPECGFANEPDVDFCGGCGRALSAIAALPTDGALKHETLEPERRQLTVMFCDLVGSTALAERLDPEELHALLAQYQDSCADAIKRYEGHIARYVGDGLLIYFGYPKAHEDDAQRGVRAGLDIIEAIQDLDTKLTNPHVNLAVRIGIATGLVVAGDIGSGERIEEKAIVGETPNIAARLQALAEPNTVLIGASTQRLVEGLFDCDDLGAQKLKGISQAVTAYRVRTESGVPSRFEAAVQRGLTPLVGREEEIELLVKRWAQAKEREGQVVLLFGEAGIGKSRIVRSFRERLEAERHNRVLYYGSPYHQNSALHPAIEQLERALRFEKEDSTSQKLDKLDAALGHLELLTSDYAPLLASLLSLSTNGRYPSLELDAERFKKKTLEAIAVVIQAMSSQQPVLMVVEDVHWIDPSTLELIGLLIEQLQSSRFFLLITCRPEFASPWGAHALVTSFTLNRLGRKESAAMIAKVTGGKALPDEVHDEIVAKTDGVPLFIEELTKTVLESDLLHDADDHYALAGPLPPLAIPASLQDSLMARLDRLGQVKEVAQLAATLGRTFSHELLAAVSPLKENALDDALTQLAQAELIYRRSLPPDARYEFKHALVQDAAYQSLLKSTRQKYHQRIAKVLKEQFPKTAETQPELLAHHYTEAGQAVEAIDYWLQAGSRAAERSANQEAVEHLNKGLAVLEALPESTERLRQELNFQIALGSPLTATKGYGSTATARTYTRAHELCELLDETERLFPVLHGEYLQRLIGNDHLAAGEIATQCLQLGERHKDSGAILMGHRMLAFVHLFLGDLAAVTAHADKALSLYDPKQHGALRFHYVNDARVGSLIPLAYHQWLCGLPDQAFQTSAEAIAYARELNHANTLAYALLHVGSLLAAVARDAPAAEAWGNELLALSEEQGFSTWLAWGRVPAGWAIAKRDRYDEGVSLLCEGLEKLLAGGHNAWRPLHLSLLAELYIDGGKFQEALQTLDEARLLVERTEERMWEAEIRRLIGEARLAQHMDTSEEAETRFQQAINVAQRQGARSLELRATVSLARLLRNEGQGTEARLMLDAVYGQFTEGFDTADLKEARALLGELPST